MEKNKAFWQFPWKYKQSFVIFTILSLIGILIEYISKGRGITPLSFPNNLIILSAIILLIVLIHIFYKNNPFIKWLSSIPAAISTITIFVIVILLMGFIPQEDNNGILKLLGITHITTSWLYFISSFSLIIVLGFTTFKRIFPLNIRNATFSLNHLGLWITIVGASFGTGDLQRLNIPCYYNKPIWYGFDKHNETLELPFALELKEFTIEDWHPDIILIDNNTGKLIEKGKSKDDLKSGQILKIKDFTIKIDSFLLSSIRMGKNYVGIIDIGASPSAYISVNDTLKGWISSGSFKYPNDMLRINKEYSIGMTMAQPKKFSSRLKLFSKDQDIKEINIEVNKPVKVLDWELYQVSYDEEKGKWSDYSVIEAVRDPWLIVTYIGIYMLLAGSVLLFWFGKR